MTNLTDIQRRALHRTLRSAIETEDDLKHLLILECGWRPADIVLGRTISSQLLDVILWTERNGCTDQLIAGLQSYCPGNPELQDFLANNWWLASQGRTAAAPPAKYAPVYGLIAGSSLYAEVVARLGPPTARRDADDQLVCTYADQGLEITFDGEAGQNPPVQMIRIAAAAGELPHGLQPAMPRTQWEAILSAIYGPPREGRSALTATFEPVAGVRGNRVMLALEGERIVSVAISSPSPYR